MITAFELAGFFAAHAVWCVSDGGTLTPMLAYTTEAGERRMDRLVEPELATSVARGKERLDGNPMDANDAALLYDGRITLSSGKVDAILIETRAYFSPKSKAMVAIPYTPREAGGFRVHKPKLLAWDHCDDFDLGAAFEAFFQGVAQHEKGAAVWNSALDESL